MPVPLDRTGCLTNRMRLLHAGDMPTRTYRTEILVPAVNGLSADDLLAAAMTGANATEQGECESGTATTHPGGMVSIRLKFTAPDDDTAITIVTAARRDIPAASDMSALATGTGRHHRRITTTR